MRSLVLAAALLFAQAVPSLAEWTATEQNRYYTVGGDTGIALYEAIGEKGPLIGDRRTIAHTTWDLKWRRDYHPENGGCRMRSALPFLTITYTLPKAQKNLPQDLAARWENFARGIAAHEKVHGDMIREMVDEIIAATVGTTVENDPDCRKTRAAVFEKVKAAHENYRARSRAFDRAEMSDGGNVHQLILRLVNG